VIASPGSRMRGMSEDVAPSAASATHTGVHAMPQPHRQASGRNIGAPVHTGAPVQPLAIALLPAGTHAAAALHLALPQLPALGYFSTAMNAACLALWRVCSSCCCCS
jgi:hypothetical protein